MRLILFAQRRCICQTLHTELLVRCTLSTCYVQLTSADSWLVCVYSCCSAIAYRSSKHGQLRIQQTCVPSPIFLRNPTRLCCYRWDFNTLFGRLPFLLLSLFRLSIMYRITKCMPVDNARSSKTEKSFPKAINYKKSLGSRHVNHNRFNNAQARMYNVTRGFFPIRG